ncbi:MAG: hypothetical protein VX527_08385 [Planctomycetota bacterium]|nr:hypothetical protein [Planctomycetota bacterium]
MYRIKRLPLVLAALMILVMLPTGTLAADIVYTTDGQELKGEIVQETERLIIFRYVDPTLGFETTITLPKSTIEKIDRNVQAEGMDKPVHSNPKPADSKPDQAMPATSDDVDAGASASADGRATTIYVVSMKGQVGTDITERIYEEIIEDIKKQQPDVLVLKLDSSNLRNEFQEGSDDIIEGDSSHRDREQQNLWDSENIRAVRTMFSDELPDDIRQVMWVRDAVGSSAIYALAWDEMYMHPDALFGGMSSYVMRYRNAAGDDNVRAKFGDAAFGWIRGITQYGNNPKNPNSTRVRLVEALSKPEMLLSVSFKGRMPVWRNDLKGDFIIDPSDEAAFIIPAYVCDDVCLSDGIAETMDDLTVLLGERNYRILEGPADEIIVEHHEGWTKAWDRALDAWKDYKKWLGRVSGPSRLANIGKAEKALKLLIGLTRKWPEVTTRSQGFFNQTDLEILLEELDRMRRSGRDGRGSGGSGGGGLAR